MGLLLGLKVKVLEIKSKASGGTLTNQSFLFFCLILVKISSISFPNCVWSESRSCMLGGPVQVITLSIWFNVEFPGNMGFPRIIYPSMHPKLQTSAGFEYFFEPSKISGARYHLVAMYSVKSGGKLSYLSWNTDRTNPKSQILARQSSLTSTLEGLISLWMSSAVCR